MPPPSNPVVRLSHRGNGSLQMVGSMGGGGLRWPFPRLRGPGMGQGRRGRKDRLEWVGPVARSQQGCAVCMRAGSVLGLRAGCHGWEGRSPAAGGRVWPLRGPPQWMADAVISSQGGRPLLHLVTEGCGPTASPGQLTSEASAPPPPRHYACRGWGWLTWRVPQKLRSSPSPWAEKLGARTIWDL